MSEIKTFEHVPNIEDFINIDDDSAKSEIPINDDIINVVLHKEYRNQDREIHSKNIACRTVSNLFISPGCHADVNELF